jgi:hypothetical protein
VPEPTEIPGLPGIWIGAVAGVASFAAGALLDEDSPLHVTVWGGIPVALNVLGIALAYSAARRAVLRHGAGRADRKPVGLVVDGEPVPERDGPEA